MPAMTSPLSARKESQLWLKMFIVAPSLMKEDMFLLFLLFCVSNLDPHQCQIQLEGTNIALVTCTRRISIVLGLPSPMNTRATSQFVEEMTSGLGASSPPNPISNHHQGLGNPALSNIPHAKAGSSFGSKVTPVNVLNLQHTLSDNPT